MKAIKTIVTKKMKKEFYVKCARLAAIKAIKRVI